MKEICTACNCNLKQNLVPLSSWWTWGTITFMNLIFFLVGHTTLVVNNESLMLINIT